MVRTLAIYRDCYCFYLFLTSSSPYLHTQLMSSQASETRASQAAKEEGGRGEQQLSKQQV